LGRPEQFRRVGTLARLALAHYNLGNVEVAPLNYGVLAFRRRIRICGKNQIAMAEAERTVFETERTQTPADQEFRTFFNKARTLLDLAESVLDARIAAAKGDHEQAIKYWEKGSRNRRQAELR
jgi:hypothetical protein